ncbi:MAG: tetratricopeptide repeat protein [Alphaproteobacteria bacterium]|nr:tetratricopeptide repeat protein [Alphaproteobacteria bacterium]
MSREEAARWGAWLVLLALIALAWSNALHGAFTYDDKVEVIGNKTIRFLEQWRLVLAYNWSRPITIGTYALNFHAAGFEPFSYHVVDVVLHGVTAGIAMLLGVALAEARQLPRPLWFGFFGAGLWALHPLTTESVTYVTGRSEQLCALFYLLGCLAWTRWCLEGGAARAALALGAMVLGIFSKEVAVTMPVAFLLIEVFAIRGGDLRAVRWRRYAPWALAVLAFLGLRWRIYGAITTPHPALRPLGVQVFTEAEVIWRYVQLSVVPLGQSVFHDHAPTGPTARSIAAMLGLIGIVGGSIAARSRAPLIALGSLWFLLVLAPSSSVVPLKETMAEHRAYVSLLGLCWIAAAGLSRLPRNAAVAVFAAAAMLLGTLTWKRNAVWATEVSLWADATQQNTASAEAWYGYGDALRLAKRLPEARDAYTRSAELAPGLLDAWNNLGMVEAMSGRDKAAEDTWRKLLRDHPTYCKAHNNLGLLHARNERPLDAAAEFRTTLAYCPRDCRAHRYLGELYAGPVDDREKAILHLETFLDVCPDDTMSDEVRALLNKLTF